MERINHLIRYVASNGWQVTVYNANMLFSCVCVFFFMYWYKQKYHIETKHFLLTMLVLYPVGYLWMTIHTRLELGMPDITGGNIVRVFIYYPLFLFPVSKITKINLYRLLDYISPGLALLQAIDHITCVFTGCCHGYPVSWGIWNIKVKDYLFPNQWLESLVSFVIFLILMKVGKRRNFCGDGKSYSLFLIIFGSTRFLLEFLRDNKKLFWGISNLAMHAAFMVFVGIMLMVQIESEKKKT